MQLQNRAAWCFGKVQTPGTQCIPIETLHLCKFKWQSGSVLGTKLKIAENHWLIVTDELQFEIGKIQLKKKGSDGGHNGLKSVQDLMGTGNYPRLRIGIGNDFFSGQQVDYVLGKWSEDQKVEVEKAISEATQIVRSFVAIGIDRTMSMYNKKKRRQGD